jgi:hypothetical protein
MRTIVAASILNVIVAMGFIIVSIPARASIPCEQLLRQARALQASENLTDTDAHRVIALMGDAVEECNDDDDVRADRLLVESMSIMGSGEKSTP